jgi:hypothetical protein
MRPFVLSSSAVFLASLLASAPSGAQQPPHIQVAGDLNGPHRILVDGALVHTEEGAFSVHVKRTILTAGLRFVLLEINSGGTACPVMYRTLDLSGSRPTISSQFGTCSDLPRTEVRAGTFRVVLPRTNGRGNQTFIFSPAKPPVNASSPSTLVDLWIVANGQCRGGSGDDPRTPAACDRRQALGHQLDALNWCYGRRGEYGYQMQWHRCGPTSTRP